MAYSFEEIERKVYPKTFLKDVRVGLNFKGKCLDFDRLANFFATHFKITMDKGETFDGLTINSEDGLVRLEFAESSLEITMRHPAYREFGYALQWIPLMQDYLGQMSVCNITRLYVSKYNELGYVLPQGIGPDVIMREVFSNEMLSFGGNGKCLLDDEAPSFANITRWEKFGTFDGEDEWNSLFSFEYGFSRKTTEQNKGCLTLKTMVESRNACIAAGDIETVMIEFNKVLDRGFHWCVTGSIVKKMEE